MTNTITGLRPAARIAGVSHMTIKDWIGRYGIGEFRDGAWRIRRDRLELVVRTKKMLKEMGAS